MRLYRAPLASFCTFWPAPKATCCMLYPFAFFTTPSFSSLFSIGRVFLCCSGWPWTSGSAVQVVGILSVCCLSTLLFIKKLICLFVFIGVEPRASHRLSTQVYWVTPHLHYTAFWKKYIMLSLASCVWFLGWSIGPFLHAEFPRM